jgi:hypothetical protein
MNKPILIAILLIVFYFAFVRSSEGMSSRSTHTIKKGQGKWKGDVEIIRCRGKPASTPRGAIRKERRNFARQGAEYRDRKLRMYQKEKNAIIKTTGGYAIAKMRDNAIPVKSSERVISTNIGIIDGCDVDIQKGVEIVGTVVVAKRGRNNSRIRRGNNNNKLRRCRRKLRRCRARKSTGGGW